MDEHLEVGACPFPHCGKLESWKVWKTRPCCCNPSAQSSGHNRSGMIFQTFHIVESLKRPLCMYVCMVITYSRVWINRARGQLNREKIFPCPRACLRIWSRETGSAVPSRVSLLISILRLNLVYENSINLSIKYTRLLRHHRRAPPVAYHTRPRGRTDRKRVDWGLEVDGKCEGSGTR